MPDRPALYGVNSDLNYFLFYKVPKHFFIIATPLHCSRARET